MYHGVRFVAPLGLSVALRKPDRNLFSNEFRIEENLYDVTPFRHMLFGVRFAVHICRRPNPRSSTPSVSGREYTSPRSKNTRYGPAGRSRRCSHVDQG